MSGVLDGALIRLFNEETHVEEFRKGDIRMMSWGSYNRIEMEKAGKPNDGTYSEFEGMRWVGHPDETGNIPCRIGRMWADPKSTISVAVTDPQRYHYTKISCYYALCPEGEREICKLIDSRVIDFRKYYCLITSTSNFEQKVDDALNDLKLKFCRGRVSYNLKDGYMGSVAPYQKEEQHAWQKEYRIIVQDVKQEDPYYLPVGDLKSITVWGSIEDLMNGTIDGGRIYIPNYKR